MRKCTISTILLLAAVLLPSIWAQSSAPAAILPATPNLSGFVLEPYAQTFTCSGCVVGNAAPVFSIAGSVPSGLQFTSNGVLSGSPSSAISSYFFTVSATVNSVFQAQQSYTFTTLLHEGFVSTSTIPPVTGGASFTRTILANQNSFWQVVSSTLPSGVTVTLPQYYGVSATISGTFPAVLSPTTYSVLLAATSVLTDEVLRQTFSITANPAPSLSASFASGEVTLPYSGTPVVTGGAAPFTFSLTGGSPLPPGLTLNAATGAVTGIPTQAGLFPFTLSLLDASGAAASRPSSITIFPAPFVTGSLPTGQIGAPYLGTLTASGGVSPYTFSVVQGSLPPGLSLSTGGVISGTPTVVGTAQFVVRVTDGYGAFSASNTAISINAPALGILTSSLPAATIGNPYSAILTATGGNSPYAWTLDSGTLPPGVTLNSAGVISGTPGPTSLASYVFTARVNDSFGASSTFSNAVTRVFTLQVNAPAITITTAALPNGAVGVAYAITLSASGGVSSYSWSAGPLPAGLTLSSAGVLSGTPTAVSSGPVSITVTDAQNQTASKTFPLTIGDTPVLNGNLGDGVVGTAYTGSVTMTGGTPPYSFSVATGSLPAGLTLSPSGAVTGTPTTAGISTFTIQGLDAARISASKAFTVTIRPAVTITTGGTLPVGFRNRPYTTQLIASGGTAPLTFALAAGPLPGGLSLTSAGVLSGTPVTLGSVTFSVRVTDQTGGTGTGVFTLLVVDAPTITTASLPNGTVGVSYTAALSGQGTAPLSWSVSGGALPDGLSLAPDGQITGTPTRLGSFAFTILLSDGNQPALTVSQDYAVTIVAPQLPSVTVTQIGATTASATQPAFGVALAQPYPLDLAGVATLSFAPVSGPGDPDVKFANGQTSIPFTIPAGQTAAVPPAGMPLAFQAGTTAGVITITVRFTAGGQPVNPNPAVVRTITVPPAAPVITSVKIATTSTGFNVLVAGYSNTREISASTFTFTTSSGATLATSQFSVGVSAAFVTWFNSAASANFGGQFLFTMPFTISQGSASSLASVQVTLTNGAGTGTGSGNF